jgi:phenylacetate-CoA ligase
MMWNPEIETMPRPQLERLQAERLRATVRRAYERVPLYRERLEAAGVRPESVRGLEDLARLPFTRKSDLRDTYPFGLFAVPLDEVVRLHASSGTTGKPTVVGYTRADVELWADVCARCFGLAGARRGDVFHNAYGYGLFTGGLGMHYGAERMGLTVVPVSGGNTERQILLIQDMRPTVIACTPSYALTLAEAMRARGMDPRSTSLRVGILGAEPWTEGMRSEIEAGLGIDAVDIYGLSEVIGPGVACESVATKSGAHICEDHFLPEIVHPETGEPLPWGSEGELVFTCITKEATPLLRYRTGDVTRLDPTPGADGRTHARMGRVVGRTDDMLIIRGVNVYPSQVETALVGLANLTPHYQLVVRRERTLDELEVRVEVSEDFFRRVGQEVLEDETHEAGDAARRLRGDVERALYGALGLHTRVMISAPNSLPRSEGGKLKRVVDERKPTPTAPSPAGTSSGRSHEGRG